MKGNEALAEGAMRAGCRFFFGYPITPQTELAAYMSKQMPKIGGTYLQAESEIAAINMVYGAARRRCARHDLVLLARASRLKQRGHHLHGRRRAARRHRQRACAAARASAASSPARATTGRPPARCGHGDFRMLVFAPSTVQETVDFVQHGLRRGRPATATPVMVPGRRPARPDDGARGAARAHRPRQPTGQGLGHHAATRAETHPQRRQLPVPAGRRGLRAPQPRAL